MTPIPFMYIIRGRYRTSGTIANAYFRLVGLPSQYRRFKVEVVSFYHNVDTPVANTLVEIKADFPFLNGYDTLNGRLACIASNAFNNMGSTSFEFMVENFNGRLINFNIYDNDAANENGLDDWVLYLKMTGIDD